MKRRKPRAKRVEEGLGASERLKLVGSFKVSSFRRMVEEGLGAIERGATNSFVEFLY